MAKKMKKVEKPKVDEEVLSRLDELAYAVIVAYEEGNEDNIEKAEADYREYADEHAVKGGATEQVLDDDE